MAQHTASTTTPQGSTRGLIGSVLGFVALVLAVLAALVLIVVPMATGSHTYSVLTSSMRPHLPPGTLLISRPVPFDSLKVGDVITYQLESGRADVISHRIISTTPDQQGNTELITQGDNNDFPDDAPVRDVQVRGKLFYAVPYAGFLANWLGNQNRGLGAQIAALVLIAYGASNVIGGVVSRRRKARTQEAPAVVLAAGSAVEESVVEESAAAKAAVPGAPAVPLASPIGAVAQVPSAGSGALAADEVLAGFHQPADHSRGFRSRPGAPRPTGRRRREKVTR